MELGNKIKKLRISLGITQEELGKILKVSTQALSKWENGGLPDVELIPEIAKYFNVSTDYLLDVPTNDYKDIEQKFCNYISSLKSEEERLHKLYKIGYLASIATFSECNINDYNIEEIMNKNDNNYSLTNLQDGFAFTSLNKAFPYFLVFPKPQDNMFDEAIKNKQAQLLFFKEMSNEDFYNTLIYINSRVNKNFTLELIEKELKINKDKANEIITKMVDYKIVNLNELELNDEIIKTYNLNDSPLIITFLAMVNNIIDRPNCFYHYVNNHNGEYFTKKGASND